MDADEIKSIINRRIDEDAGFANDIERALEAGLWEVVANLVVDAIGYAVGKVKEFVQWLKDNW